MTALTPYYDGAAVYLRIGTYLSTNHVLIYPTPGMRRSLRRDLNFDKLVAKAYPDKGVFETHQLEVGKNI